MSTTPRRCSSTKTSGRKCCCTHSRVTTSASLLTARRAPASPTPWWASRTSRTSRASSHWYQPPLAKFLTKQSNQKQHFGVTSSFYPCVCFPLFHHPVVRRPFHEDQRQHEQQHVLLRGGESSSSCLCPSAYESLLTNKKTSTFELREDLECRVVAEFNISTILFQSFFILFSLYSFIFSLDLNP